MRVLPRRREAGKAARGSKDAAASRAVFAAASFRSATCPLQREHLRSRRPPPPDVLRSVRTGVKQKIENGHSVHKWWMKLRVLRVSIVILPHQLDSALGKAGRLDIGFGRRARHVGARTGLLEDFEQALLALFAETELAR